MLTRELVSQELPRVLDDLNILCKASHVGKFASMGETRAGIEGKLNISVAITEVYLKLVREISKKYNTEISYIQHYDAGSIKWNYKNGNLISKKKLE